MFNLKFKTFLQDVVRAPLNWHLAESTAIELQKASDNLVQLYKRISLDYDLEEGPRKELLHKLASTAGVAQQTLRPVMPAGYALSHVSFFAEACFFYMSPYLELTCMIHFCLLHPSKVFK